MFLYYFPNKNTEDITDIYLLQSGLAHLAGLDLQFSIVSANGPDGGFGVIKAIKQGGFYQSVKKVGYYKQEQTWHKYKDYYIGYYNDNKPTPDGLVKRNGDGFVCETDAGNFVISPQRFMPSKILINDNNEIEYQPKDECKPLLSQMEKVMISDFESRIVTVDMVNLCAMAISMNYYIGLPECNILGVFDNNSVFRIIEAVCDLRALESMLAARQDKKKAEE